MAQIAATRALNSGPTKPVPASSASWSIALMTSEIAPPSIEHTLGS